MTEDELYPTPDEYDDYTMKESPTYTPPKVWQWNQDEENRFSKINRPIAGPTHEKDLPVEHPLQLYSLATPNGVKVTVMLEELLALGIEEAEYDAWLVNIWKIQILINQDGEPGSQPTQRCPHLTLMGRGVRVRGQPSLFETWRVSQDDLSRAPSARYFGRWGAKRFSEVGA